jgi:MFS family permease
MMTGGGLGTLIGGQIYAWVGGYGWRYVMFTGVLPALVLLLIRRGLAEPERFEVVRARRKALQAARSMSDDDRTFLSFVPA